MTTAAATTERQTPRDCVVVFQMPEPAAGVQIVVVKNQAIHNVQPGCWYRTSAVSFPEACKRAAHYAAACSEAAVVPVTRWVLDQYVEVPITEEMVGYLYSRPTPRISMIGQMRTRVDTN